MPIWQERFDIWNVYFGKFHLAVMLIYAFKPLPRAEKPIYLTTLNIEPSLYAEFPKLTGLGKAFLVATYTQ